jgi:predicted  nucleic acid-binding Zn-ribbon protein
MVLRAEIAAAESDIVAELETVEDLRAEAAARIPAQLSSLYEQLRAKLGGVGAARLEPGGRCGGCHLTLPATEVARIKRGSADAVVQCDQCGRILVRSE